MKRIDARTARVVMTAGATYLGRFGTGVVVLITLPMAKQHLHPELFGVWMMLSALLGFMAFADLGIGNGVLNRTTHAQATNDKKLLLRTLASGYACTTFVASALFAAWITWAHYSEEPTIIAGTIAQTHKSDVLTALTVFAAVLALNIPASLIQRVQLGMQQGYWNGIAQFVCAILTLAAVPLTLQHDGSVAGLVLATLGIQAGVNIVNTLIWLARHGLLDPSEWRNTLDFPTVGALLRSGSLFLSLQLAAAFAFQSDSIVITQTLGQAAYGDFAVTQKLFLFVSMVLSASLVGLWPAFGDAIAKRNTDWIIKTLWRSAIGAASVALASVLALSAAMPWIMKNWMHGQVNPSWSLVAALATWTVIDAAANVLGAFMNGANILRAQLFFAVTMAICAFGAKWLLTPTLGTTGAVLATILAYCLISVPGQVYIFKKALKS
ncbi:lipopolysaccharide biosynthesis protein [Rubrivivax gelatinosus]|uniref:Polysaccharide biosynthesis family protein n=1 Tax=Rubrivivax gelatinosus (strain NBRC 100245 / IL144) TaxID=983917 RepID=I0HWS6_RUBGI|nr:lipopolysaccharide biosynthesis protein [Rubrivivax gelatinosus]BAL97463.1 polysaccharide biosynthesis family protein [Rubrivivax gelatinosus IL144]